MEYTRLGNSGLKVSRICLGCMSFGDPDKWLKWVMGKEEAFKLVEKAWKAGINFYDTANAYSSGDSERVLGAAIKHLGIPRDEIVIATKVFFPQDIFGIKKPVAGALNSIKVNGHGLSRKHIFEACEASLQRLQTHYIDLYQIHRWDEDTPIEETMKALHDLVQSGKVRYIGASTMYAWQFAKAQSVAKENGWTQFVSMQNLYNLVYREEEREMNPFCVDQGVGIIPWSPLHRGFLTRTKESTTKTLREQEESDTARLKDYWVNDDALNNVRDAVQKIATDRKVTMAEVSLAWLLHKEGVASPIVGVSKVEQLDPLLRAVNLKLTQKEMEALEAPYRPRSVLGGHTPRKVRAKL